MDDSIFKYCEDHTSQPSAEINDIYRSIALHTAMPHISSTPYQGQLLRLLSLMVRPRLAVEVGSFAGFGAVHIAQGIPEDGCLHIVEANEECEPLITEHLQQAHVAHKVQLHIGQGADVIPQLPDGIGLAFVDADKLNYERYYDLLLPKMAPGGLLIFDNMLWYGRVMETAETDLRCDRSTRIIQALNSRITADPRVDNILLPLRDGLMICRVREDDEKC